MIIILIISIIILLVLLSCYLYVFIRVTQTYDGNTESYISLTTTPSRIGKIKPTIDSFLNQSLKPSGIILNIPKLSFKGEQYVIPDWLIEYDKTTILTINKVDKDYGPGTKLYGSLNVITNPNAIIIIADDDIVHSHDWFENIVSYCERDNSTVYTYVKWNFHGIDVAQGYMGFGIRRYMITDDILDFPDISCQRGDDLWISMHLHNKGIKIDSIIPHLFSVFLRMRYKSFMFEPEAKGGAKNNDDNYEKCYSFSVR